MLRHEAARLLFGKSTHFGDVISKTVAAQLAHV
jgi:hypothetical protein